MAARTKEYVFECSICGEASQEICSHCTKDACSRHYCVICKRCSDCCDCPQPLAEIDARNTGETPVQD